MEVNFINPVTDPDWDCLAASHRDFGFFHSAAWAKVLTRTYGHEPFYLRCSQRSELVSLIPMMEVRSPLTGRRGVCLPFRDFSLPLCFDEAAPATGVDELTGVARRRKWKYFEVRGGKAFEGSAAPASI